MTTARVTEMTDRELDRFAASHARSGQLRDAADGALLSGVPMNWMTRWPGGFPVVFDSAEGASLTDVDGNSYVDFCLGDTGAMSGHSPAPTVAAAAARMARGITTMLPSEDAGPLGAELSRRFGLRHWQFSLTASDANRFVLRLCREITGRSKILVFNHCYHGSVDETVATLDAEGHAAPGGRRPRGWAPSARRCRSARRRGWSSGTTPRRSSASSLMETSPASSPSR